MSHSDEEEPVSLHESDEDDNEDDDNVDDNGAAAAAESEGTHDVEDNFDDEEEVLVPKPFPHTILLSLPNGVSVVADGSDTSSDGATLQEPVRVHVCLTRGAMSAVKAAQEHGSPEGDEREEGVATSAHGSVHSLGESAASRMQGCCAAAHAFDVDYAVRLAAVRRRHILRRLHGNPERQRRFLEQERRAAQRRAPQAAAAAADGGEEGDEGGADAGAHAVDELDEKTDPVEGVVWPWTAAQRPPPYWLPSLLANDVATFQRVLQVMYGWVIAPEPHPADRLRLNSKGQLLSGPVRGGGGAGEEGHPSDGEDDDDVDQADPAHHKPDFFLPSNAFAGADEEEDEDAAEQAKERSGMTDRGEDTRGSQRPSKSLLNDFNDCDTAESPDAPQLGPEQDSSAHSTYRRFSHNAPQAKLSTATAPPPVVALPSFPFTDYELFLAHDTESGEWHLLDTHPLFVMEACRRRRAAQMAQGKMSEGEGDGRPSAEHDDDDDVNDDDEDEDSGEVRPTSALNQQQQHANEAAENVCHVPVYDMSSLIPVSPIVLAALFSGPALRCCLLQPLATDGSAAADAQDENGPPDAIAGRRLSDHAVLRTFDTAWLATDVSVALPILATICRARQHVLQHDATRIPYTLAPLWLDSRPLFNLPGFKDATQRATPADVRQWCVRPEEKAFADDDDGASTQWELPSRPATAMAVSTVLPHKWGAALDHILPAEHYGRVVLAALLAAEVLPTQALRLPLFTQLDGLRLAVWWWLRLPSTLLRRWSVDGSAADDGAADTDHLDAEDNTDGTDMQDDDGEGDVPLDTLRPEEATELLMQRVAAQQQRTAATARRRQRALGPVLLFAPLLQRVLIELQRRLDRSTAEDSHGDALPPSQFSLQESVARTYAVERLDSGRPRQDPLVTSAFIGAAAAASSSSSLSPSSAANVRNAPEGQAAMTATTAAAVRHHRIYQSDLALLALALTTTPAPPSRHSVADVAETMTQTTATAADVAVDGSGDADGHKALFEHILDAKLLRCVRSPLDRARAGTTKMLLLSAADFCTSAARAAVFSRLPPFELFGNSSYCPLPELVRAWSRAATRTLDGPCPQMQRTVHDFAFYLWNEVRWRLCRGQYSAATVARMKEELPELLDCVESHTEAYYAILARLQAEAEESDAEATTTHGGVSPTTTTTSATTPRLPHKANRAGQRTGRPQRPSLIGGPALQANKQEALVETYSAASSPPSPAATFYPAVAAGGAADETAITALPLTVAHPNAYSAAVLDAKAHVYALWAGFPVSPLTYFTPEALYVLLFGRPSGTDGGIFAAASSSPRRFNAAALRVLLEHGVHTVQPCPLDAPEMPAIEAALIRSDVETVKVLLGLGAASLRDLRHDGSATLESWAECIFSPADMAVLHFVEAKNAKAARADPRVQYGARRFEAAPIHV